MKKITILFILGLTIIIGCKSQKNIHAKNKIDQVEYSVGAVLWQQSSAEYRALCYQAFNLAKLQLDKALKDWEHVNKPKAIITDIDETVLDNSPYSGKQIVLNEEFTEARWTNWVERKEAKSVPGALDFLTYANQRGVAIFYISNRSVSHTDATLANMKALGFPNADKAHLLLMDKSSGKEMRRAKVQASHQILLLLGDNLSDFDDVFENSGTESRHKSADQLQLAFGTKFIVLPNPMYGDWEINGIYEGNYQLNAQEKKAMRLKKVKHY
ncbi:5'-nucleotidase, lipoprotein e(P4) family [Flavobacteriaceae bacterium F08102]|nr:5'-nucleotidase, lipoprotein e(P4) family [Flavobacteriaceae bacterium F08102]